jgi:2-polyprenyl-6-hydroxyphenyl methylase/3-demethylubiquinone-9 3-methyltransferase
MRFLPIGTHRWGDFVTPTELNSMADIAAMQFLTKIGMAYNLFTNTWRTTADIGVNYVHVYKKTAIVE